MLLFQFCQHYERRASRLPNYVCFIRYVLVIIHDLDCDDAAHTERIAIEDCGIDSGGHPVVVWDKSTYIARMCRRVFL